MAMSEYIWLINIFVHINYTFSFLKKPPIYTNMYSVQVIPIPQRRMRRVQEAAAVAPTRRVAGAPEVAAPVQEPPDAPMLLNV